MKDIGYGKGYKYAHDHNDAVVDQTHLPEKLLARKYYSPTERGFEKELIERLKAINILKKNRNKTRVIFFMLLFIFFFYI